MMFLKYYRFAGL